MKIACIGDNCIDYYQRINRKYPTGNVVDTAVNLIKLGASASVISTTGNDENGKWMLKTLVNEGVDISHLKVAQGATAITFMDMNGHERIHGEYQEGVLQNIVFDEKDVAFASTHDLVHTALWGKAENILPAVKAKNIPVSFDYADRLYDPLIESTLPYVDYGFYSYHKGRDSYIESFLINKVERGMRVAVATFGEKGSLARDKEKFYEGPIYPATVVNTVGAGDSFIAGFLYALLMGRNTEEALDCGARIAAEVVAVFEPWVATDK